MRAMTLKPESAVILIPSLEPDDRLPAYMRRLLAAGFTRAVVVDDGSSEKYQPIFNELAEMEGVTVLHHEVNRGKGCALKTGYSYILENHLTAIDITATAFAMENNTPIHIFGLDNPENITKVIMGEKLGTIVKGGSQK